MIYNYYIYNNININLYFNISSSTEYTTGLKL